VSVPLLESLLPAGPARTPAEHLAAVRAHERAPADRPFVFGNFVTSVDGHATIEGRSQALGGPGDLEMLLALRAMADAVLLGTSTLTVEGYARLVGAEHRRAARAAAGLAPDPPAVLVTRSGRVPWEAGLFAAREQPVLIYGPAVPPPGLAAPVEVIATPDLRAVLADLRARGVRALLSEAGPTFTRSLVGEGLLDELFLTASPLVTADVTQPGLLAGPALPTPAALDLRWVLHHAGELFLRYGVSPVA